MSERRPLVQGLKPAMPPVVADAEKRFVFGDRPTPSSAPPPARAPLTTRIRADFAAALKRASLERQLSGTTPNTLQEMLEEALEPWLRGNGYLP